MYTDARGLKPNLQIMTAGPQICCDIKLELENHNQNLMTKRDLGFDHEDICRKLEIIPGFHL